MMNVGINASHGEDLLQQGLGDLVAFGRDYVANPDLVERIRVSGPFNKQRLDSYYGATGIGYTDYSALAQIAEMEMQHV